MALQKAKLFSTYGQFLAFITLLFILFLSRLGFLYSEYRVFIAKPFYYTSAQLIEHYVKNNHTILRLHSEDLDMNFISSTNDQIDDNITHLRVKLLPNAKISFIDYLGLSFIPLQIKEQFVQESFKHELEEKISAQHDDKLIASFHQGIFLATSMIKPLRESVATLGISHIITLSGFHLSIIWGVFYILLLYPYRFFQKKYFPQRLPLLDIGFITLSILGIFTWFVGYPAPLVRSYGMVAMGWFLLLMGVELLSFEFLFAVAFITLALFPKFIVHLGFWFSVIGVFYIFLIVKWFAQFPKIVIFLLVESLVFFFMLPIVNLFFGTLSLAFLFSPLLSAVFIPYYPLSIFMHFIGFGNFVDIPLKALIYHDFKPTIIMLPWFLGVAYIALSFASMFSKKIFYTLIAVALTYGLWIFGYQLAIIS